MRKNAQQFDPSYLESYRHCYSISEPVEDHEARLALYGH